jgi:hypothetical protein
MRENCANSVGFSKADSELISRIFRFLEPREVAGYETCRVCGDLAGFEYLTCDIFTLAMVSCSQLHAHSDYARPRTGFAAIFLGMLHRVQTESARLFLLVATCWPI